MLGCLTDLLLILNSTITYEGIKNSLAWTIYTYGIIKN
jgi:hypothetical protein